MTELLWGVASIAGLAALFYLLMPLHIFVTMSLEIEDVISDIDQSEIDPPDLKYFSQISATLETIGFVSVGDLKIEGMVANVTLVFRMLVHEANGAAALVGAVHSKVSGVPQPVKHYFEFSSDYLDGSEFVTSTSIDGATVDLPPDKKVLALPQIDDPILLYDCHKHWLAGLAGGKTPRRVPLDQTPAGMLEAEVTRQMKRKVAFGTWRDAGDGLYRLRLVNAYLMTWSQLPPWKQVREARMVRRAKAFVRQAIAAKDQQASY